MNLFSLPKLLAFGMTALVVTACTAPTPLPPTAEPTPAAPTISTNWVDGCVSDYSAETDYFPEKLTVSTAAAFSVSYHKNYKLVTVNAPFAGGEPVTYVLLQCGTPAPTDHPEATLIEVPVKRFVSMSTTYLPFLEQFGKLDTLVGVDVGTYTYSPAVLEMIAAGKVQEIGSGSRVDAEAALALDPDVVMTYASGAPDYDAHPKLQEIGLPVFLNAEYLETNPLARAEWGKLIATLFNQEAVANAWFQAVSTDYQAKRELALTAENQPTVLLNAPYEGVWYLPGGAGYMAQFVADAGGNYLWADEPGSATLSLDFESVFERGADADFWLVSGFFASTTDLLAIDERMGEFAPIANQTVYNSDARQNAAGSNDFYESAVANPQVVLADLIAILHPDLLADHTLTYWRQLPQ
jgi:iron complex transport system substrate-binding protein